LVALTVTAWWLMVWVGCSKIDEMACKQAGAEYAGTSVMFEGFCSSQGVEFPVEALRADD